MTGTQTPPQTAPEQAGSIANRDLTVTFGGPRPEIITLCGSTRFMDEWNKQRKDLTEQGAIVLAIEVVTPQTPGIDPQHVNPELKQLLDQVHLRKIDLADRILVLNVGGYIGDSTRNEIRYATARGIRIDYLEPLQSTAEENAS